MELEDEVLLRARALISAMSAVNVPEQINKAIVIEHMDDGISSQPSHDNKPIQGFSCAAFNGSSLITTYGDIRSFVVQGGIIIIDSNKVKTSATGEWSANRIELAEDYSGETNLEATISFVKGNEKIKRAKQASSAVPVESSEILKALEGLNDVNLYCNNRR